MKIIECKGKKYETTYDFPILEKEKLEYLRKEYYKKPLLNDVKKEFICISKGGSKNTNITNYYVRDLMDKTLNSKTKWSIEDAIQNDELLSLFWYRTTLNKKVFLDTDSVRRKIDTIFRIGAMGLVSRPSNFPIKKVNEILETYNINNNYYDFSCGWGARLTSALKNKVNYFGTDPNYMLTEKLKQLSHDYKETLKINTVVDIRTQGSEIFVPEWENKIGLAFSSPPYFDLEDYKIGYQSFREGTTYQQWKTNYLEPTIKNIYKYLIDDGIFAINIKNLNEYKLVDDTLNIAKRNGFYFIEKIPLELCKKSNIKEKTGFSGIDEQIYIFSKKENIKKECQLTIFDNFEEVQK